MDDLAPITIDVVSDVVCPWCYMGLKRLDRAMAADPQVRVDVRWRPFQLDATIPPEGKDRQEYMIAKFGSKQRVDEGHARLEQLGKAEGIAFDFNAIERAPNTLDAHRLIRWAGAMGPDVQGEVVRRLFSLFFEHGADISDREVLLGVARDAGMDVAVVETLLSGDADVEDVRQEIATAQDMGISGVPCFLLESRYAVMGAQDAEVLADAIRKVAEAKAKGELETAG